MTMMFCAWMAINFAHFTTKIQSHQLHWCPAPTALLCRAGHTLPCRGGAPAQMCVGWLAAGITSPVPYRKQIKPPKKEHRLLWFRVQGTPSSWGTPPTRTECRERLPHPVHWFNKNCILYFGNAWQTHVRWVFWISAGTACGRAQDGATTDQVTVKCHGKHSCIWFGFAVGKEANAEAQN